MRKGIDGLARARWTDPPTSLEAAKRVEKKGKAERQRASLLRAVSSQPGWTAAEYADLIRIDRYDASRRLPELRKRNLIENGEARVCAITGTKAMTWRPAVAKELTQGELL